MTQALYRKWRPHLWEGVIGQEHVVRTLQNAIRTDRVAHAYLFAGPRGTGKTTSARLLAKAVNCLEETVTRRPCDQCAYCQLVNEGRFMDLIEIDAASNTSVDDVRQLRDTINFAPSQGRYKVYIIDEVHMLSTAAFNALLKTLEEPPPHAIFILATTEVHKIPATVLSRCQRHEFRRISVQEISGLLREMCQKENIEFDDEALVVIARQATGSMRDAISLLDQLASTGERITLASAQEVLGTATSQAVVALVDAILDQEPAAGMDCIHQALDSGTDPRQFARQVVEYLRGLLMIHMGNPDQVEATSEMRQKMTGQAHRFDLPILLDCLRLYNTAASEVRGGWQPGLLLELAMAGAVTAKNPPLSAQAQPQASTPEAKPARKPAVPVSDEPALTAQARPAPRVLKHETEPPKDEAPAETPPARSAPKVQARSPAAAKPEIPPDQPKKGAGQSVELANIQQNWSRIKQAAKDLRVNMSGLLNSCTLVSIKDGVLVIGFSSDVLKQKMEAGDNLQLARQAIQRVLGQDVPVMCVVMGNKGGSSPEMDIEGDGIVGTALNLGGHIVQKKKTD
jgi:DNA polymerase-3 subunit gamma/tau